MSLLATFDWKTRSKAATVHLVICGIVVSLAAALVFLIWFPYPYRALSGGQSLFLLVVSVDLVLGPVLTWIVFDKRKPRAELVRDLAVVGLLQLSALGYGLWSVYQARPVYLVHEVDRFVVVSAADVDPVDLPLATPNFQSLPFAGVATIGLRPHRDAGERLKSLELALAGKGQPVRPEYWQPLSAANRDMMRARAQTVRALMDRSPEDRMLLQEWLRQNERAEDQLLVLPVESRSLFWAALLDVKTLAIVGYVPIDPF